MHKVEVEHFFNLVLLYFFCCGLGNEPTQGLGVYYCIGYGTID